MSLRAALSALSLFALTACATGPTLLLNTGSELLDAGAGDERILFATVRGPSDDAQLMFGGQRNDDITYGEVTVRIPPKREQGELNYPSQRVNLDRDFIARDISLLGSDAALQSVINSRLANMPAATRAVSLFFHGYNTDFAEGVYLSAQMVRDFQFPGVPVHFSWASAGITPAYLFDLESANVARADVVKTIRLLTKTQAQDVVLVAHSMGGMVLMEALRQIGLEGDRKTLDRIATVVLAAPDIDIDVFEEQLRTVAPRPFPILVFVSRNDPALRISSRLRGNASRVGDGSAVDRLRALDVAVVDLTDIDGSLADEHNKFANSPFVINMIRQADTVRNSLDATPEDAINAIAGSITDVSNAVVTAVTE